MLLKQKHSDEIELTISLAQAKKLYRALFASLHASGFAAIDDLDDDDMLLTLQQYLQHRANEAGVDCTIHSEWEAFLGMPDAPSCEQRFSGRPSSE